MGTPLRCVLMVATVASVGCVDFYLGYHAPGDVLMVRDRLYKPKVPFSYAVSTYGRVLNCPITYVFVTDRLGVGHGPITRIVRGGLKKTFIALRITSAYNTPLSVSITIRCQGKKLHTKSKPTTDAATTDDHEDTEEPTTGHTEDGETTTQAKTTEHVPEPNSGENTNSTSGNSTADSEPGSENGTNVDPGGGETNGTFFIRSHPQKNKAFAQPKSKTKASNRHVVAKPVTKARSKPVTKAHAKTALGKSKARMKTASKQRSVAKKTRKPKGHRDGGIASLDVFEGTNEGTTDAQTTVTTKTV